MTSNATVTQRTVTTTVDEYGDATVVTADTVWAWGIIAPRTSVERVEPHSPAVVTAATIYGPGGTAIDSDDLLIVSGHSPTMDGTWQVEGIPGDWKSPYTDWHPGIEVAVKRAGAV